MLNIKRTTMEPWKILVIGILMFIGGGYFGLYFGPQSPDTRVIGIIVAVIGGILVFIVFTKWRNQLNDWMDNR